MQHPLDYIRLTGRGLIAYSMFLGMLLVGPFVRFFWPETDLGQWIVQHGLRPWWFGCAAAIVVADVVSQQAGTPLRESILDVPDRHLTRTARTIDSIQSRLGGILWFVALVFPLHVVRAVAQWNVDAVWNSVLAVCLFGLALTANRHYAIRYEQWGWSSSIACVVMPIVISTGVACLVIWKDWVR